MIRTRFAPSPTGFLHIGGARTALFSWAFARRHGGSFILRIEDTDLARSTPEAVQAILDGMNWLGLKHDEGPFYQTQRMARYQAVIEEMLAAGTAYHCYMAPEELDRLREEQRAQGLKARYNGAWRPEPGKVLPPPPAGVSPAVRFRNPGDGVVAWDDLVKGRIEIANAELDDLVIARADGTPTYNFCVVVDDFDMGITHVIRGDDHVNNTPRQINILRALGVQVPQYAHLSMILGDDGQKLSKRHGAVSVMQYDDEGYLPEAVLNYLARLGWSHGDEEIFSMAQFCAWFDLDHITPSAAQFNTEKLNWLNAHYLKRADAARLAALVLPRLQARGVTVSATPSLPAIVTLYQERVANLNELADAAEVFYVDIAPKAELRAKHLTPEALPALADFVAGLPDIAWEAAAIGALIKQSVAAHGLKMPKLAMPLRVLLTGQEQTPSVDALVVLFPRQEVLRRLSGAG
ncbi:MAG: Glutamate--tRNA ligase [Candidatus Accumulibacter regalis]|jgi:glutamyl-tRNA synthetase (EC 6.1.1.17)|uniref:Glutamate--tRNA ligase n=1 Tax=Accumulibacter regalis TaxID=522306 RepID=A0A011NRB8_ACCRE|nr:MULTISPECIES: glutamate--tRNA ligase [unclassified Candidatus Accumulibacter]EXI85298.1 MAG: Glutamate--tRNA ligase [Candidatus Accumulibacter regalis]MBN8514083.1 glutamate--tRNA ligase [Accumulibacter sp.]MBO3702289.1 glutamate--tRNA ligase [Accumulibacter sp.]HRE71142.1 glutamate--tRNA ligase [Accumulibacter sp.]